LEELQGFTAYLEGVVADCSEAIERHRRIEKSLQEKTPEPNPVAQAWAAQIAADQRTAVNRHRERLLAELKVKDYQAWVRLTNADGAHPPVVPARPVSLCNLDLDADNPDSRQREHHVLMAAARQLSRIPSLDEALGILDQPEGYWNDKRRKRVFGTLRYIARSFDAGKCKRGGERPQVDLDRYTTIFTHRYRGRKINAGKLSAFVSAVEWSLDHPVRGDASVPRNWITKLTGLSNEMCRRLAQVVVRERIFDCDLSEYRRDQARRWRIGNNFPGREWWRARKKEASLRSMLRIELRRGKLPVVAPLRSAPVSLPLSGLDVGEVFSSTFTPHTTYHNSLVSKRTSFYPSAGSLWWHPGRGPPDEPMPIPDWSG
jgi:hypothetical protein